MFSSITPLSSMIGQAPGPAADPDEALVDAWVNRGDADAFAGLVGLHQLYVFRLALSVLGPGFEADAEDVAQEAFIRVAERLQGFRGECRFRTWLHRLALNLALDRRRRSRWSRPHLDLEALERRAAVEGGDDPFTAAADAERALALHRCLDTLPESLRTAIHLRYWLDLTIDDIARILRLPIGTVKSHLHRGRTLLFRAMDAKGLGRGRGVPGGHVLARPPSLDALGRPRVCLEAQP
jgi:RNA polymerase sigma-70 factor, ECF subfamily